MTWDEAKDALQAFFVDRWTILHAGIPIHRTNTKPITADSQTGTWLRLRFLPSYSRRIVLGGQTRVQGGIVLINVFVPLATGDGLSDAYAREIEEIWESAHTYGLDGAIHLDAPGQIPGAPDDDAQMWRGGITVPFTIYHQPV